MKGELQYHCFLENVMLKNQSWHLIPIRCLSEMKSKSMSHDLILETKINSLSSIYSWTFLNLIPNV